MSGLIQKMGDLICDVFLPDLTLIYNFILQDILGSSAVSLARRKHRAHHASS